MNCWKIFLLFTLLAAAGCGHKNVEKAPVTPAGISWFSLLNDASDLSTLAQAVDPSVQAKMISSASDPNKVMLAYLAPEIIGDMDYGCFTRIETNADGIHATLAEFDGPGVVTWVWSANPVGILKLYIDGNDQPTLSMLFADFLKGDFLPVADPFGTVTARGYDLHFPIVHARHCKLVVVVPHKVELAKLYYQVSWQSLRPDTAIQPFDLTSIKQGADTIKAIGNKLTAVSRAAGPSAPLEKPQLIEYLVNPGQTVEIFHKTGPQAIDAIRFTAKTKSDLGGLQLEANWDGETAIQAPLTMLAGVSPDMEDTASLPATVKGPSVSLRWFMPFANEGRLLCTNASSHPCKFAVEIWTQPIDAARYPLRFHANVSKHEKLHPKDGSCLTFVEAHGQGRFVGCALNVDSHGQQWWGEGDNIVWLDDTNVPAVHGTGTEDYFGFAWCSTAEFNHPFRGQTSVTQDPEHWTSNMHRYHLLDSLPYQHWGLFQFQALGLGTEEMDWTATMMWYGVAK